MVCPTHIVLQIVGAARVAEHGGRGRGQRVYFARGAFREPLGRGLSGGEEVDRAPPSILQVGVPAALALPARPPSPEWDTAAFPEIGEVSSRGEFAWCVARPSGSARRCRESTSGVTARCDASAAHEHSKDLRLFSHGTISQLCAASFANRCFRVLYIGDRCELRRYTLASRR